MRRFKQLLAGRQVTQGVAVRSRKQGFEIPLKRWFGVASHLPCRLLRQRHDNDERTQLLGTSGAYHSKSPAAQSQNSPGRYPPANAIALSRRLAATQSRPRGIPDSICRRRRVAGTFCRQQFRPGRHPVPQCRGCTRDDPTIDPRRAARVDHATLRRADLALARSRLACMQLNTIRLRVDQSVLMMWKRWI